MSGGATGLGRSPWTVKAGFCCPANIAMSFRTMTGGCPAGSSTMKTNPSSKRRRASSGRRPGLSAASWTHLWTTTPDATIRFQRHFLLATDLTMDEPDPSEGEDISISWFAPEQVREMALNGEIREEISALALLRYLPKE